MSNKHLIKGKYSMYKIFAVMAFTCMLLAIVSFAFFGTKDNKKFDKEINKSIKYLVEQVIQIQYNTHDKAMLEKIFTEELQQNLEDYHPNFFREESLHFVNRNYMETLHYFENGEEWMVSVRIHEGFFKDSFWLVIGVTQNEDGEYFVSFVGRDK